MLVTGLLLGLVGCKAQQTNMKLKKANEKLAQAEAVDAPKYADDLVKQAREAIDAANSNLSGGQTTEALAQAKSALDLAQQALDKSKTQFATDISNRAKDAVEIATLNQGETEDPVRFQKIRDLYNKISQARTDSKWDDVINLSQQVVSEVDLLLKRLKSEAERKLVESQKGLTDLRSENAEQYAPERLIDVTDLVLQVEQLIKQNQDYINARNKADLAIQKAREGIDAVKREKCKEAISEIETNIVIAVEEGADLYAEAKLREVNQAYDALSADFQENKFEKVLLATDLLKDKVKILVNTTKRAAAQARMDKLSETISKLVEAGVKEYLPGRVEVLEKMSAQARDLFRLEKTDEEKNRDYDTIKQISQDALLEEEKIKSAFSDLALEEIRITQDELEKTLAVFERMARVFIIEPKPGMSELDLRFENAKEALRAELGTVLQNSQVNLQVARQRQQDEKYKGSIVLSKDVRETVEYVLGEIYHVVGFNATMELAAKITEYEIEGAMKYAPDELSRTRNLLEDTKRKMAERAYKEAVTQAANTRAQMELMAQRIIQRANLSIQEAEQSIAEARTVETLRYKSDEHNEAQELKNSAATALANSELKKAVELAELAKDKALAAAKDAQRLAAEDEMENARARIRRANEAEANFYATKELDDAKELLKSAENHFTQESYSVARNIAVAAAEKAERAFYKLIDDADAAINEAKTAGGWDLNRPALADAIGKNDEARRVMELGQYSQSATLADTARKRALSVAVQSKLANYDSQVKRIRENLEHGRLQGITMFQVEDAIEIKQQLVHIEDQFDRRGLGNYEFVMNELTKLEAQLRNALDTTEEKVYQVIDGQYAELNQLVEAGATLYAVALVDNARSGLKNARISFRNKLYKTAHADLSQAISSIREIRRRHEQEQYVTQVRLIFADLTQAERNFDSVLSRGAVMLKKLAQGDHGRGRQINITSVYSPNKYREEVEKIFSRALVMQPPPNQQRTHQEVLAALNDARLAALTFEKMVIFDQVRQDEAEQTIDRAYDYLYSARKRISSLQSRFAAEEELYRQAGSGLASLAR
jgi:hypothetical protein